jgi:hypothetical protein
MDIAHLSTAFPALLAVERHGFLLRDKSAEEKEIGWYLHSNNFMIFVRFLTIFFPLPGKNYYFC